MVILDIEVTSAWRFFDLLMCMSKIVALHFSIYSLLRSREKRRERERARSGEWALSELYWNWNAAHLTYEMNENDWWWLCFFRISSIWHAWPSHTSHSWMGEREYHLTKPKIKRRHISRNYIKYVNKYGHIESAVIDFIFFSGLSRHHFTKYDGLHWLYLNCYSIYVCVVAVLCFFFQFSMWRIQFPHRCGRKLYLTNQMYDVIIIDIKYRKIKIESSPDTRFNWIRII